MRSPSLSGAAILTSAPCRFTVTVSPAYANFSPCTSMSTSAATRVLRRGVEILVGIETTILCRPPAVVLETTVQQQHSLLFGVAYKGVEPMFAQRAHGVDVLNVFVPNDKPGFFSDIQ